MPVIPVVRASQLSGLAKSSPASPLLLVETDHVKYGQVVIRVKKIKQGNVCFTCVIREGQSEGIKHGDVRGRQVQGSDHQALEAFVRSLGFIPNMLIHYWRALPQAYIAIKRQRRIQTHGCVSLKPAFSPCYHTMQLPRKLAIKMLKTWKQFSVLASMALWDLCPYLLT